MSVPFHKVFITGGGGFIGTHIAERLLPFADIVLFDNFRRDSLSLAPALQSASNVEVVTGDILDAESIRAAIDGADVVLHLAAIAGVSSYYSEPLTTLHVNILGTINLLQEAVRAGVKMVVDFSTSEVFGPDALWVDEQSPHGIGPVSDLRWTYAVSKLAGEHLTLRTTRKHAIKGVVLRPFNIYGPRQTGEGAISNFSRAVLTGEPMTIYGEGSPIRAWCYISDMVDAVMAVLDHQPDGEVFNIGNPGEVETTLGLARRFQRLVPDAQVQFKEMSRSEVRSRVPVIDKARRILGFAPQVDLDVGLRKTLDWTRDNLTSKKEPQ
jgi:nucleoside-diphosphate-sugar epimerase